MNALTRRLRPPRYTGNRSKNRIQVAANEHTRGGPPQSADTRGRPSAGDRTGNEEQAPLAGPGYCLVRRWCRRGPTQLLHGAQRAPDRHGRACLAKYTTGPHVSRPSATAWTAFGPSQLTQASASLAVRPSPAMQAADEWFGVSMPVTASCDYEIRFRAVLSKPLYNVPGAGYGYGIGVRGDVDNGVPTATTIQYDPPFGGLRTVDVPSNANAPGYPPTPFPGMTPGRPHDWKIIVQGSTMLVSLDGHTYPQVRLDVGSGNQLIVRVWNAKVTITMMSVTKLRPRF